MSHTITTPGLGPTRCVDDCGSCDDCRASDHWVAKPCHCPTCSEAADLDPGSTFTPLSSVLTEVAQERARQDAKWGEQNHPDADPVLLNREGGVTPVRLAEHHEIASGTRARSLCQTAEHRGQQSFMSILVEEIGEACDEIAKGDTSALREELVQIAAVAVQWVEAIDRRAEREGADDA